MSGILMKFVNFKKRSNSLFIWPDQISIMPLVERMRAKEKKEGLPLYQLIYTIYNSNEFTHLLNIAGRWRRG